MILNKNKGIGEVIYIVEGDVGEQSIIIDLFNKVLDYEIVSYDKRKDIIVEMKNRTNNYSRVYIIPAEYPQISKLNLNSNYFDKAFKILGKYCLDRDNASIYFLFDRDRLCNRPYEIEKKMDVYKNSRDNGFEMNGLFLLNYPSVESFYLNCSKDRFNVELGKELKEYLETKNVSINENNIVDGMSEFIEILETMKIDFDLKYIDCFNETNKRILSSQNKYFENNRKFVTLSMIFVSLVDLGIIML